MKVNEMRDFLFNIENQDMTIRELRYVLFELENQFEEVTPQVINNAE